MKIYEKIQKLFSSAICVIVAILTSIIGVFSVFKSAYFNLVVNLSSEVAIIKTDNIFLNIVLLVAILGILFFLYKRVISKINSKILFILTIVFSLLIGFWWVNYLKLIPISDQSMVIYSAEKIIDNELGVVLNPGNYLSRNPHQLGFVLYIAAIFKIFNTRKAIVLQNFTVFFSGMNVILMYFIVKEIFEEKNVHKLSLILIAFFSIYFMFFSPHVYGNLFGLMFGLIAILFTLKFLKSNSLLHVFFVAISITLSYLLKSNYEIFLIAIIIELILKVISEFSNNSINRKTIKDNVIKSIIGIVCIIVSVFGVKLIVYNCFAKITGYKLDNGVPVISYIYMGIAKPQTLTPGWYTGDVEAIYNESGYSKEKSKEITNKLMSKRIKELSKNPQYTFEFFKNKIETTWLNPTFQTIWCSTPGIILDLDANYNSYIVARKLIISILCGKAFGVEERVMDIYQIIVFLTASLALFVNYKKGKLEEMLLPIIFLGGFTFHVIWETKSIYVLQYYYLLVPYASYGLYKLFGFLEFYGNIIRKKSDIRKIKNK